MRRPSEITYRAALMDARRGNPHRLERLIKQMPTASTALLKDALELAEVQADYGILMSVLAHAEDAETRADALATVLNLADASHPNFADLMDSLHDGEQTLVLGTLIEASRLEPDPERRLLRLKKLVKVIPQDSRPLYWPEAEALAEQGGDDAQLALLGFVRDLPPPVRPLTLDTLRRAVRKVRSMFKRAAAFIALADITQLSQEDVREAEVSAARIPEETLRIMTLTRLSQLKSRASG